MGNSLGPIHEFFFLNSVGDTIFFNSVGKMPLIFGSKLDIVSEPYISFNTSALQRYVLRL